MNCHNVRGPSSLFRGLKPPTVDLIHVAHGFTIVRGPSSLFRGLKLIKLILVDSPADRSADPPRYSEDCNRAAALERVQSQTAWRDRSRSALLFVSRIADFHPARSWHGLWLGCRCFASQFNHHKPCHHRADANARVKILPEALSTA